MKSYKLKNHKYANMTIIENDLSCKEIGEYKTYTLMSYTTSILTVAPKMVVLGDSLYSMTTRKHVSWFIDWCHKMGILPKISIHASREGSDSTVKLSPDDRTSRHGFREPGFLRFRHRQISCLFLLGAWGSRL